MNDLRWTTEKPTRRGLYLVRLPGGHDPSPRRIFVRQRIDGTLRAESFADGVIPVHQFADSVEWAGPIPEPAGPTG